MNDKPNKNSNDELEASGRSLGDPPDDQAGDQAGNPIESSNSSGADGSQSHDEVEANIERLLGHAYSPQAPDPQFVDQLKQQMITQAQDQLRNQVPEALRAQSELHLSREDSGQEPDNPWSWPRIAITWTAVAACLLLGFGFLLYQAFETQRRNSNSQQPTARSVPDKKNNQLEKTAGSLERNKKPTETLMGLKQRAGDKQIVARDPDAGPIKGPINGKVKTPSNDATNFDVANAHLTPRKRPENKQVVTVGVGKTITTGAGQKRRVVLPDGSVLYINQESEVRIEQGRRLYVSKGEVFIEVAPSIAVVGEPAAKGDAANSESGLKSDFSNAAGRFVVRTPARNITAMGTQFSVKVTAGGTAVMVTQGKVSIREAQTDDSKREFLVYAGQQLAPDAASQGSGPKMRAALRATHMLAWTRDLIAAAESPLVPGSKYAGGAMMAVGANGQHLRLSLRRYHVNVYIEDGFARTTIDQTYFNHANRRLEGTFHFPLPADASLSRLAMYVDGALTEGGMVEREYGRKVFNEIVRRQKDPALLEWVDGTTFKMRVFPLEPREEKRILISYTQKLQSLYGRTSYRFPGGHSLGIIDNWSFKAHVKNGALLSWKSPNHATMKGRTDKNNLILEASAKLMRPNKDVVLELLNPKTKENWKAESLDFTAVDYDGYRYLMLRYGPDLPVAERRRRRDWVFLFESSADRSPLLARVQIEVIKTLLENAEHQDTFNIVIAGTQTGVYAAKSPKATPANIKKAIAFLDRVHLIGALDLSAALDTAGQLLAKPTNKKTPAQQEGKQDENATWNPHLVHVGSGIAVLGQRREDLLLERIPKGVPYIGVAVGKRWSRLFMKHAAERSGGYVIQINPDQQISWRARQLLATLNQPRLMDLHVLDPTEKMRFLRFEDSVVHGQRFTAVARIKKTATLPDSIMITGVLDGKRIRREIQIKNIKKNITGVGHYLPRQWAKLEIDRLLSDDAAQNKLRIIGLSKSMYVMSPYTSLIVLENEQMYSKYKVDRGRKDHWAMYPAPDEIAIIFEPDPINPISQHTRGRDAERLRRITKRIDPSLVKVPAKDPQADQDKKLNAARNEVLSSILVRRTPILLRWSGQGRNRQPRPHSALELFDKDVARKHRWQSSKQLSSTAAKKIELEFARLEKQWKQEPVPDDPAALRKLAERRATIKATIAARFSEMEQLERIHGFLKQARVLQMDQQYEDALSQLNEALSIDPDNPAALLMKDMIEDAEIYTRIRKMRRDKNYKIARNSLQNYRAVMPHPQLVIYPTDWPRLTREQLMQRNTNWNVSRNALQNYQAAMPHPQLIIYPTDWPKLTRDRLWQGNIFDDRMRPIDLTPADARVISKLAQPQPINFEENKLDTVIEYLRNTTGENFYVNWAALKQIGVRRDAPVSLQLRGVPVDRVLDLVLEQVVDPNRTDGLNWTISDGIVIVSTDRDLGISRPTRRFIAQDLARMVPWGDPVSRQFSYISDLNPQILLKRTDPLPVADQAPSGMLRLPKQHEELTTQLEIEMTKVDQYAYQLKLLQEEIVAMTERNGQLLTFVRSKGLSQNQIVSVSVPFIPVQGQITKVEQLPSGKLLAQINVGLNSKVPKYMKFLVHRGDLFLGHLKITFVDDTSAAGILTPRSRQTKIVPGDLVRTALSGSDPDNDVRLVEVPTQQPQTRRQYDVRDLLGKRPAATEVPSFDLHNIWSTAIGHRQWRIFAEFNSGDWALNRNGSQNISGRIGQLVRQNLGLNLSQQDAANSAAVRQRDGQLIVSGSADDHRRVERVLANMRAFENLSGVDALGPGGPGRSSGAGAAANFGVGLPAYRPLDKEQDWRAFGKLLHHAPAMNTMPDDVLSTLESQLALDKADQDKRGKIDPKALQLIEDARAAGWMKLTLPAAPGQAGQAGQAENTTALVLLFDGSGRHTYQHRLPNGLREQVICDGQTLWHLYPDLGVGAKRRFSRFHHRHLTEAAPWLLPSADVLALNANVILVDERTVALTPLNADPKTTHLRMHLVFDRPDGQIAGQTNGAARLVQRHLILMPEKKLLYKHVYQADGKVRIEDGQGNLLQQRTLSLEKVAAPNLTPDQKKLVILPMPIRTADFLKQAEKLGHKDHSQWTEDQALAVIAANMDLETDVLPSRSGETLMRLFVDRFLLRGDRRLGLYVLMSECGLVWNPRVAVYTRVDGKKFPRMNPLEDHPDSPLALYLYQNLELIGNRHSLHDLLPGTVNQHPLFKRMASLRYVAAVGAAIGAAGRTGGDADGQTNHDNGQRVIDRAQARRQVMQLLKECDDPALAWLIVSLIPQQHRDMTFYATLSDTLDRIGTGAEVRDAVNYQFARTLVQQNRPADARRIFTVLTRSRIDRGLLPLVGRSVRQAFVGNDKDRQRWSEIWRKASTRLLRNRQGNEAAYLVWQCHHLGDQSLADALMEKIAADPVASKNLGVVLSVIEYLLSTDRNDRAAALLDPFLKHKRYEQLPMIWRLAAVIAARREQLLLSLKYQHRALDLRIGELGDVYRVDLVRDEFGRLLDRYEMMATARRLLGQKAPDDFVADVIRAADQWRALDPDSATPCSRAADILTKVGRNELAWSYMTTPLANYPGQARPWSRLAKSLHKRGDYLLADRAYATAFSIDTTNAQLLWDRAQVLKSLNRNDEVQKLLRKIVDGDWDDRYKHVSESAHQYLNN